MDPHEAVETLAEAQPVGGMEMVMQKHSESGAVVVTMSGWCAP
jgi:hypothetical protein